MKKLLLFPLLALSILPLASCDFGTTDEPEEEAKPAVTHDPSEPKSISISGDLTKKHYGLNESWSYSGLKAKLNTWGGTSRDLNTNECTFSASPKKTSDFVSVLSVYVSLKSNSSVSGAKNITGISVDSPTYDEAQEITNYYSDVNINLTGESLRAALQEHSFKKHTYFVPYGKTNSYKTKNKDHESVDLIPNQSKNQEFYTGAATGYGAGTREHVWACHDSAGLWDHNGSGVHYVDDDDYIGGGSDLYHVRPLDTRINTARGDAPFVDFDDSEHRSKSHSTFKVSGTSQGIEVSPSGTTEFANYVEVADNMKGDVARIVAYLYMHYKTSSKTPSKYSYMCGDLDITDVIGYSSSSRCFQKLVMWNNLDPVSEVEKYRNHTVQLIQGNRNPFVDDPTLLTKLFQ